MNIKIRPAVLSDLEAVTQAEALCFPPAEAADKETFLARLQTFPESFLIAEKDNEIIGFINGCVTNDKTISDEMFEQAGRHDPTGDYQSIFGLDVIPEYRHQGLATLLMRNMIELARAKGRKGLILTCKDSLIGFYESFGYRNLGVSASVHGGAVWYDMILEF